MDVEVKFYILEGAEWRRFPKSALDRNAKHRYPQFASSRQLFVEAVYCIDAHGRLTHLRLGGSYKPFDSDGKMDREKSLDETVTAHWGNHQLNVLRLDPIINLQKARVIKEAQATRWRQTTEDEAKIASDLTGDIKLKMIKPGPKRQINEAC